MNTVQDQIVFSREAEAPRLPPPANLTGAGSYLRKNYFNSIGSGTMTVVLFALIVWIAWKLVSFALINATWSGDTRESCLANGLPGACWPFVAEKIGQWIYGFYPIGERWRVNLCFLAFAAGLVPMLTPRVPYKIWNAGYLLFLFPLVTFVLLTGGNASFSVGTYLRALSLVFFVAALLPIAVLGFEEGLSRNRIGLALAGAVCFLWVFSLGIDRGPKLFGVAADIVLLSIASGVSSLWVLLRDPDTRAARPVGMWFFGLAGLLVAMGILGFDFGLAPVESAQWGGLTLTLIVSVTGISASLPLGILLALGRQSRMPAVKALCVAFIEVVRGVPLITVLFTASVMLPLLLPPGMNFDKLLRALVGVALFSSAYMAEVVRGGLQAIPKTQHEGAMALGLSYWQIMIKIVLPQALKISIPNIVSNFIVLFKDTTLVLIIGLFDLLAIAQTGLRDAAWSTPVTAPTGYLVIALIYWAFCFGMSRYASYTERRLHTGHKR